MQRLKQLLSWDEALGGRIRIQDEKSLNFRIAAWIAHSGDSWLWCGTLFLFWLFSSGEREKQLAWWGGCIAITAFLIFWLKKAIPRQRPEGDWGEIYRKGDPHSFPSGHAVRGGLIIMLAVQTFGWSWITGLLILWALAMVSSRVLTGVHYPADVVAGLLLGISLGLLYATLQPWIFSTFAILFDKSRWG